LNVKKKQGTRDAAAGRPKIRQHHTGYAGKSQTSRHTDYGYGCWPTLTKDFQIAQSLQPWHDMPNDSPALSPDISKTLIKFNWLEDRRHSTLSRALYLWEKDGPYRSQEIGANDELPFLALDQA